MNESMKDWPTRARPHFRATRAVPVLQKVRSLWRRRALTLSFDVQRLYVEAAHHALQAFAPSRIAEAPSKRLHLVRK